VACLSFSDGSDRDNGNVGGSIDDNRSHGGGGSNEDLGVVAVGVVVEVVGVALTVKIVAMVIVEAMMVGLGMSAVVMVVVVAVYDGYD